MKYNISDKVLCVKDPYSLFEINKVYEIENIRDNRWFKLREIDAYFSINILDEYFKVLDKEYNKMNSSLHKSHELKNREIYKIGDLIRYTTPENPNNNYGHIVAIFEIKDDKNKLNINKILYKVSDLYKSNRMPTDVIESDVIEVYRKVSK